MDPVTHASVAMLAAVAMVPTLTTGNRARRGALLAVAALAGIIADADSFVSRFPADTGGLDYMLHHRGATHTVLGAMALGLLLAAVAWLASRLLRRERRPSFRELALVSVVGCELHWLFDGFIDYGVHPLWPYNAWFYGDFLFLAEPLSWVALIPAVASWIAAVAFRAATNRRRFELALPLLAVLWTWLQTGALRDLPLPGPLVETWIIPGAALFVTASMVASVAALRRWPGLKVPVATLLLVLFSFFGASRLAKAEAARQLSQIQAPGERVEHIVTTATAANPFCWRVVTSSHADGGRVVKVRMASVSLFPWLTDAGSCVISNREPPPSGAITVWNRQPESRAWNWFGQFEGKVSDFGELGPKNCRLAATRHFLRAPFWVTRGNSVVVGDLRLDYFPDPKRWAKYTFTKRETWSCESLTVPPWTPPFFE